MTTENAILQELAYTLDRIHILTDIVDQRAVERRLAQVLEEIEDIAEAARIMRAYALEA